MLHSLCQAALDGNTAEIGRFLDAGAPVDECGTGYTPLMFAARYGHADAVTLLLSRGADAGHRDHNGDSAMLWAARDGHADVITLLLAAGQPADSPLDPYGQTPLHIAALWGHVDAMRVLLAAGANPKNREQIDDTPLHAATTYGFPEAVKLLLDAGADPNAVEEIFNRTPVHQAAEDREAESLRLLLDAGGEIDKRDRDGKTPLYLAAAIGMADTARLLVERGADPDAEDAKGVSVFSTLGAARAFEERNDDFLATATVLAGTVSDLDTAFAEAVWMRFDGVAMILARRGAAATGKDSNGRAALAGAAASAAPATLELALTLGADIDADGGEALAASAFAGRQDSAKRLLDLGVPVDTRTPDGRTPLHFAAMEGNVLVVVLLIERGADRNPVDAIGETVESLMQARRAAVQAQIDEAGKSAALIPTERLDEELARLKRNHAAILSLLGR